MFAIYRYTVRQNIDVDLDSDFVQGIALIQFICRQN